MRSWDGEDDVLCGSDYDIITNGMKRNGARSCSSAYYTRDRRENSPGTNPAERLLLRPSPVLYVRHIQKELKRSGSNRAVIFTPASIYTLFGVATVVCMNSVQDSCKITR